MIVFVQKPWPLTLQFRATYQMTVWPWIDWSKWFPVVERGVIVTDARMKWGCVTMSKHKLIFVLFVAMEMLLY